MDLCGVRVVLSWEAQAKPPPLKNVPPPYTTLWLYADAIPSKAAIAAKEILLHLECSTRNAIRSRQDNIPFIMSLFQTWIGNYKNWFHYPTKQKKILNMVKRSSVATTNYLISIFYLLHSPNIVKHKNPHLGYTQKI